MNSPIEEWANHRGGKTPAFQSLLKRKHNQNVVNFAAAIYGLEETCKDATTLDQLHASYQFARSLPPACLASAFAHPAMVYWNKVAQQLVPYLRDDRAIPDHLTQHLHGTNLRAGDPVRLHLTDLNRFLVSGAVLARIDVTLPCPVHDGWLSLPGLGMRFACDEPGMVPVSTRCDTRRSLTYGNAGPVDLDSLPAGSSEPAMGLFCYDGVQVLPRIRGTLGSFVLDPRDPYFRRVWLKQTFPQGICAAEVADAQLADWQRTLMDSLGLLKEVWPEIESEITAAINTVVPVSSPVEKVNISCSSEHFWGAILCSFDPPILLAEVLVHEFGHNLLFALMELYGLLAEDSPQEDRFYSPWRPDPRPLSGVLHAVYTFQQVAEYYRRLLQRDPTMQAERERYSLILRRLQIGIEVLAESAKFNAEGEAFFESLVRGVHQQRESGEAISTSQIQESLESHLATWEKTYPALRGWRGSHPTLNSR